MMLLTTGGGSTSVASVFSLIEEIRSFRSLRVEVTSRISEGRLYSGVVCSKDNSELKEG